MKVEPWSSCGETYTQTKRGKNDEILPFIIRFWVSSFVYFILSFCFPNRLIRNTIMASHMSFVEDRHLRMVSNGYLVRMAFWKVLYRNVGFGAGSRFSPEIRQLESELASPKSDL